jgi:hypothetical protein
VGEFFISLEKDLQQEDFLQGRMLGNPYSSNEHGLGPLMRDIKNKICQGKLGKAVARFKSRPSRILFLLCPWARHLTVEAPLADTPLCNKGVFNLLTTDSRYTGPSRSPRFPGRPGWRSFEFPAALECTEVTNSGHCAPRILFRMRIQNTVLPVWITLLSRSFDSITCKFSAIKYTFDQKFLILAVLPYLREYNFYYVIWSVLYCYFDQEDRDCVGEHILFTLFHSDFSHEMSFCGEFSKNSSWEAGVLEVYHAGGWWWAGVLEVYHAGGWWWKA